MFISPPPGISRGDRQSQLIFDAQANKARLLNLAYGITIN